MKQYIIPVEGMRCPMCEGHVNDNVRKVNGVLFVKADRLNKNATVVLEDNVDVKIIIEAITKDGYKVEGEPSVCEVKKTLFGYKPL